MQHRRDTCVRTTILSLMVLGVVMGGGCADEGEGEEAATSILDGPVYYVSTTGSDSATGSATSPFRTIGAAVRTVPDGSTVLVRAGTYSGRVALSRKAAQGITVRSETPYRAVLRHTDRVVTCYGCAGITLEGFDIAHAGAGASPLVVHIDGELTGTVSRVVLRNNVIHDSYNNDLLKINNGARDVLVQGNVFYNQTGSDEHIDINSVENVTVEDNVFFNDFAGSGRTVGNNTASFVVIKDSNGSSDVYTGARNVTVRRNVFLSWQGDAGTGFVLVGEDGASYFEAYDVLVENNLMIGNSATPMRSPFGVKGCRDVVFRNNTVTGDLPGSAYATRLNREIDNQVLRNIQFYNNVWADQTGTMNDFSDTPVADLGSYTLARNLYWNNGSGIPTASDDAVNHTVDLSAQRGNPMLPNPGAAIGPRWDRSCWAFTDGSTTIAGARAKLIDSYAKPGAGTAVVDKADATRTPAHDIRGAMRGGAPDLGAFEVGASGATTPPPAPGPVAPVVPTASVTAPAAGAQLRGTVAVTAAASATAVAVEFLLDGAKFAEDTSAPFAASLDSLAFANGAHTLTARARDATGASAVSTGVAVTIANVCSSAAATGAPSLSTAMATQSGRFTATVTLTPGTAAVDGGFALSATPTAFFSGSAGIVLFATDGTIRMRNGGSYAATNHVTYAVGTRYELRVVVDVASHTYSAYVRPVGGVEVVLGEGYAFRTEWQGVAALSSWLLRAELGALTACNFTIR